MDVGTKPIPFITPPVQTYDVAPFPVSVTEEPEHTVVALAFTVTVGEEFTLIVIVVVLVQLLAFVPVTVYVFVEVGIKPIPFVTPPVQTYVAAPLPVNVVEEPEHNVVELAFAVTVGVEFTFTVVVAVAEQLFPSVPVTV